MEIHNTYTFTVLDENDEVVQQKVVHNKCNWKPYIINGASSLYIQLGTMLDSDYLRYQTNGYWNEGFAGVATNSGGVEIKSGTQYEVGGANVVFKPNLDKVSGLLGSEVFFSGLKWSCQTLPRPGYAEFHGETIWGYHSYDHWANDYYLASEVGLGKGDTSQQVAVGTLPRKYQVEDDGSLTDIGQVTQEELDRNQPHVYGILISDGGLYMKSVYGSGLLTHTMPTLFKRPTDKIKIQVDAKFNNIPYSFAGTLIAPLMNAGYGHSLNQSNNSLAINSVASCDISTYPTYSARGTGNLTGFPTSGMIPPLGSRRLFNLRTPAYEAWFGTDIAMKYDKTKKKYVPKFDSWYGFPFYAYLGEGDLYQTETKVDAEGNEVTVTKYNSDQQRVYAFDKMEPTIVRSVHSGMFGPVRTIVYGGKGVNSYPSEFIPTVNGGSHEVNYIKIGTGDGVTTRFYHPFGYGSTTTDFGKAEAIYYLTGDGTVAASKITAYNKYANPFVTTPFTYYKDGSPIFDSSYKNTVLDGTNTNYDKENKCCYFGLHPFDFNYYPVTGLLGRYDSGAVIHTFGSNITLRSAWNAGRRDTYGSADLYISTSDNIYDLINGGGDTVIIRSGDYNHPQSSFELNCKRYVRFMGMDYWTLGSSYVGGMTIAGYDPMMVRISTEEEIQGYADFSTPPPSGAPIYALIDFSGCPFIGDFTEIKAKAVMKLGSEDDNTRA
jgi:hypothetical protein